MLHAALPSQQEHTQAQPALVVTLELVATLLQQSRVKCSVPMRVRVLQLAAAVDFFGLLLNSVLANCNMLAASRYAAAACMCEVLSTCEVLAAYTACVSASEQGSELQEGLRASLQALDQPLCTLLQHVVRQVGMPAQHTEANCWAGRHMLRMGLSMLKSICRILPGDRWSQ